MKSATEFWNREHERGPGFQELSSEKPSIAAVKLVGYLKSRQISLKGKLLDVGCGAGRNANWLAQQGFIDYIERTFTLEEIVSMYHPLKVEKQELIYYPSEFEGKTYERYFWWVLLLK